MKTGVYGGSFNPIHLGHVHILREFLRRLELDRVLLIPAHMPPHKSGVPLASGADRLAMCRLAAEGMDRVEVSSLELDRAGRSYTAETLETLRNLFPQDEFSLIMGEDMFLTVDRWYRPETIFSLAEICATPRQRQGMPALLEKKRELEAHWSARCRVEDIPWVPVSSTQIREYAAAGKPISSLVPPRVEEYILTHGLYKEGRHDV